MLSLWNIFAMVAVVVAPAAASTQDPLQAVADVAAGALAAPRTVPVENTDSEVKAPLATGADEWQAYKGLPVVGTLQDTTTSPHRALLISTHWPTDIRDAGGESLYLFLHSWTDSAAVVLVHPVGEGEPGGGAILEIVKNKLNNNKPRGGGWFLAVHNAFGDDSKYSGSLRLIAHKDQNKAAIFKFVPNGGKMMLQVVANRGATGVAAIGGYVMIPDGATRDSNSEYLAVSHEDNGRVSFDVKAEN